MYHSDFRSRTSVINPCPEPRIDGVDAPELHMLIGDVMDKQMAQGRAPIDVSDDMAKLLSAAVRRLPVSDVNDSFGVYAELLLASQFVLRDIYNHLLAEDDRRCTANLDLTSQLF